MIKLNFDRKISVFSSARTHQTYKRCLYHRHQIRSIIKLIKQLEERLRNESPIREREVKWLSETRASFVHIVRRMSGHESYETTREQSLDARRCN